MYRLFLYPKFLIKYPFFLGKKNIKSINEVFHYIILDYFFPFTTSSKESLYSYHNEHYTPFFVSSVFAFLFVFNFYASAPQILLPRKPPPSSG